MNQYLYTGFRKISAPIDIKYNPDAPVRKVVCRKSNLDYYMELLKSKNSNK